MKKVLIIFLICILSIYVTTSVKIELIDNDNNSIQKKIDNTNKEIKKLTNDNLKYEDNIKQLKEENKDKWEELELWTKTKEKIQEALS